MIEPLVAQLAQIDARDRIDCVTAQTAGLTVPCCIALSS